MDDATEDAADVGAAGGGTSAVAAVGAESATGKCDEDAADGARNDGDATTDVAEAECATDEAL
jgi:hypothetical protein